MECLHCLPGIIAFAAIAVVLLLLFAVVLVFLVIIVVLLIRAVHLLRSWHLKASFHTHNSTGTVRPVNVHDRVVIAVGKKQPWSSTSQICLAHQRMCHWCTHHLQDHQDHIHINMNLLLAMSNFIISFVVHC
jgi:uncharacterized membrane protein